VLLYLVTMTEDAAFDYLYTRAANEGITVTELLEMTPDSVSDCNVESATFWKQVDYSHINPVSTHPDQAHDPLNAFPEERSANRSRGAQVVTQEEIDAAEIYTEELAEEIDLDCDLDLCSVLI